MSNAPDKTTHTPKYREHFTIEEVLTKYQAQTDELERVKAERQAAIAQQDQLATTYSHAIKKAEAEKYELLAALNTAADWFARSTRIDDLEQVEDMRAAIAKHEGSNQ